MNSDEPIVGVESMAHGGSGLGHHEGRVMFVEGGVPGDIARVRVTRARRRYSQASLISLATPSPDRITPPCPVFDRCGGCDWQMISLTAQRRWKARIVAEQLQHLGGV
ncbi:MAG: TRAM domain-containing protein, partial [Acidimicrobiia bacterium]